MGHFSVQNAKQCGAFLQLLQEMNLRLAWTTESMVLKSEKASDSVDSVFDS